MMKAILTRIHSPGMGEGVQQSEVLNVGEMSGAAFATLSPSLRPLPSPLPSLG